MSFKYLSESFFAFIFTSSCMVFYSASWLPLSPQVVKVQTVNCATLQQLRHDVNWAVAFMRHQTWKGPSKTALLWSSHSHAITWTGKDKAQSLAQLCIVRQLNLGHDVKQCKATVTDATLHRAWRHDLDLALFAQLWCGTDYLLRDRGRHFPLICCSFASLVTGASLHRVWRHHDLEGLAWSCEVLCRVA